MNSFFMQDLMNLVAAIIKNRPNNGSAKYELIT